MVNRIMLPIDMDKNRLDPYKSYRFRIKLDGREVAGLSKMSTLRPTSKVTKNYDGTNKSGSMRSRTQYGAIVLERGVTYDAEFEKWANCCNPDGGRGISLQDPNKDLLIEVRSETGQIMMTYKIYRYRVSEFQSFPDLDANANAVAIEHMKIENEGWERDTSTTEPNEPQF